MRKVKSEQLRLGYVVIGYGDGEGFLMDIATSASVSDVMKRLKAEHEDLISCAAMDLKLFLGLKTDFKWFQDDDDDVGNLSNGEEIAVAKYTNSGLEMDPTKRLYSYFARVNSDSDTQSTTIYVVVQLPPSSAKLEPVKTECESRAIGAFDYEQTFDLQMALDVRNEYLHYEEPASTSIPGFVWLPKANVFEQRDRILEYLRSHLLMGMIDKSHFVIEDVSTDRDFLAVDDDRLPFSLRGTTDWVLTTKEFKMSSNLSTSIRMVIIVRQSIESQHKEQMFAQLVAASLKAPDNPGVMALLANLNEDWYFTGWIDLTGTMCWFTCGCRIRWWGGGVLE